MAEGERGAEDRRYHPPKHPTLDGNATVTDDYIKSVDIARMRVWKDEAATDAPWNVDGIDDKGGYSEDCARFLTFDEAMEALPEVVAIIAPHLLGEKIHPVIGKPADQDVPWVIQGDPGPATHEVGR
jgi:hypothetical protein